MGYTFVAEWSDVCVCVEGGGGGGRGMWMVFRPGLTNKE